MPAHAVRRSDVQPLAQRIVAESLGTAFLLAGVVGSGIMAAKLAGGNGALALLCNTLPTGAILTVLILHEIRQNIENRDGEIGGWRLPVAVRCPPRQNGK